MQQVYRCRDSTLDRDVALKFPKNKSASARFRRSCILSAQINHPNVAKTLDYFEFQGREYLIEELIAGENMHALLERYDRLDPFLVAHLAHHLAKGLAASHRAGVLHRDLKPSNAIVALEPWPEIVKITDFGIAKMADEELTAAIEFGIEKSITTSATLVGALPYMSPELINSPGTAELKSDVWSIGAVMYEMLSGTKPFGIGLAAVGKIVSGNSPPKPACFGASQQFGAHLDELWSIVEACLQFDPSGRPSADELVRRCDDLCYSSCVRRIGTISSFQFSAYGFIAPDDGLSNVFFHKDSYYGASPRVGQRVSFACFSSGTAAPRAIPVLPFRESKT